MLEILWNVPMYQCLVYEEVEVTLTFQIQISSIQPYILSVKAVFSYITKGIA